MLTQLHSEILVRVLSSLCAVDLSSVSSLNKYFNSLVRVESIWIQLARREFGVVLRTTEEDSPRLFYQSVLYPYRHTLGLWQRQNLRYYSSLLKVSATSQFLSFQEIIPPHRVGDPFQRVDFLRVSRKRRNEDVEVVNLSKIALSNQVKITCRPGEGEEAAALNIILSNIEDHTSNPRQWRDIMMEFIRQVGGQAQINEMLLMRFIQTYHSRALYSYKQVSLTWPDHGLAIKPGMFVGTYGPHGTEVINLSVADTFKGTRGVKVTGDPNVPFGEVSFELSEDDCLDIPLHLQDSIEGLQHFSLQPEHIKYQDDLEMDFVVPEDCFEREIINYRKCKGRWSCECQVAQHAFSNPSFIPGNFILFSEDVFAVLFIQLKSISVYKRVTDQL